ncbi:MAG: hypothetical protein R2769_06110 [Saprospiraceae bacterium]
MILMEMIQDILPAGVLNVVNGLELKLENLWHLIRASTKLLLQVKPQPTVDHAICFKNIVR